jgi:hypothetical protein
MTATRPGGSKTTASAIARTYKFSAARRDGWRRAVRSSLPVVAAASSASLRRGLVVAAMMTGTGTGEVFDEQP